MTAGAKFLAPAMIAERATVLTAFDRATCRRYGNLQNNPVPIHGQVIHSPPQPMSNDGAGHRNTHPELDRLEVLHLLHDVGVPKKTLTHHPPKDHSDCHSTHPSVLQWD